MTWFKVDDGFWSHPKVCGLSADAVALWVRAGSYAAQHLTDGFVARHALPMLRGLDAHADELVAAALWRPVGDGWVFHDWHQYQPMRVEVEGRRAGGCHVCEDIDHLLGAGEHPVAVAERLSRKHDSLLSHVRRHARPDLTERLNLNRTRGIPA